MQKLILKTAFIWKLEIKLGNRRDEPMNPCRDRAWPPIRNSYVPCHRFAIRTCLATDLQFERAVPPIYVDLFLLIEASIVYIPQVYLWWFVITFRTVVRLLGSDR